MTKTVNKPLRIFFDTEFTDFTNADLISVGFACECSDNTLYIVLDSWDVNECSTFVLDVVTPLLSKHSPLRQTREAAAESIEQWFDFLRDGNRDIPIYLTSDSPVDWRLLLELFVRAPAEPNWAQESNISGRIVYNELPANFMRLNFSQDTETFYRLRAQEHGCLDGDRHHALIDAISMKSAWQSTWESVLK